MTNKEIEKIAIELTNDGKTDIQIAEIINKSERTVRRYLKKLRTEGKLKYRSELELNKPQLILEKDKQRNQDLGRIDRKTLREHLRVENAIVEYNKELISLLKNYSLPKVKINKPLPLNITSTGLIHLTDLHLNELVDLEFNKSDFHVASKRLKIFVEKTKIYFKALKVNNVLLAMTGDLLNSDRRIDELLSEATNRSKATFLAVSLLEQVILDLAKDFKITTVNVVGNESRIQKDIGWSEIMATDNYDFTIYNILKFIFRKSKVKFILGNPIEQVVNVNGQNVLLIHGNQLRQKTEQAIQKIKGKYSARNVTVNFVICGHLHSARLGDTYARGSSLVGANGYSDSALQLESRASQNIHIFYNNGNRDSIKIDLQNTDKVIGYNIDKELETYNAKSIVKAKKTVIVKTIT